MPHHHIQKEDKPLAQKLDERVFEKLLKYNPQSQNLWDIVGIFENERQKLRLEVAQYHEDIKSCKIKLKELREQTKEQQELLHSLEKQIAKMPISKDDLKPQDSNEKLCAQIETLQARIADLELENSKLCIELRDLKSEAQLQENLIHIETIQPNKEEQ